MTLMLRADEMGSFFKNRLYPDRTINQAKQRVSTMDRNEALQPSSNSSNNDNHIPLVITYHPSNIPIRNIIVKNFELLRKHESTKHVFTDPPITAYRRERNIRDRINLFVHVILNLHQALPNANVPDAKHVRMFFIQLKLPVLTGFVIT